jgi:hypothetical protein
MKRLQRMTHSVVYRKPTMRDSIKEITHGRLQTILNIFASGYLAVLKYPVSFHLHYHYVLRMSTE